MIGIVCVLNGEFLKPIRQLTKEETTIFSTEIYIKFLGFVMLSNFKLLIKFICYTPVNKSQTYSGGVGDKFMHNLCDTFAKHSS